MQNKNPGRGLLSARINLWNRNNSFPHGSQNNSAKHGIVRDLPFPAETPTREKYGSIRVRPFLRAIAKFRISF